MSSGISPGQKIENRIDPSSRCRRQMSAPLMSGTMYACDQSPLPQECSFWFKNQRQNNHPIPTTRTPIASSDDGRINRSKSDGGAGRREVRAAGDVLATDAADT